MCKRARLSAVAEHGDRLAGEGLPHEVRDHHPVSTGLTRSDSVEKANDDDRQLPLFPVGQRQELVDRLAARVCPPMLRSRSEHEISVFAERHIIALAVDLGGRSNHHELFFLVGVLQHNLGAMHVRFDRMYRLLDNQLHPDGGCKVEHHVASVDELGQQRFVVDRVDEVFEPGPAFEMGDVVDRSGREIIQDQHLAALIEQRFRQMRPDEPGAAGYQRTHAVRPVAGRNARSAAATSFTSSLLMAGLSGSEITSSQARAAAGQSAGDAVRKAGCCGTGTG